MPNPSFREESATCSALVDAQTQVNILAETHGRETAQLTVKAAANAHIERARIELPIHLLFAATNTASREERSHAVTDGLLHICEACVSPVWSAPSIAILPFQLFVNHFQKVGRQDTIAIEEDEILALAMLCSEVSRLSRSAILFCIITKLKLAGIAMDDILARLARTILNDDDLHVLERLFCKALEQFIDFVRTIIYGNYDGVLQNN